MWNGRVKCPGNAHDAKRTQLLGKHEKHSTPFYRNHPDTGPGRILVSHLKNVHGAKLRVFGGACVG